MDDDQRSDMAAEIPTPSQRLDATQMAGLHPALMPVDALLDQCVSRTQRRSGPGGQHRNKTSSGVFLCHQPTQIVVEATERRSQADNRAVALQRLRFRLATELRTPSILDGPVSEEEEVRERFRGHSMRIADGNDRKPALLALVLNDLHASGGQPRVVAGLWGTTTSAIVRLVKSHPPAFTLANAIRRHHDRHPLK